MPSVSWSLVHVSPRSPFVLRKKDGSRRAESGRATVGPRFMSYTALARRYRSQSFVDVVGQEPIAQTLISAIGASFFG